MRTLKALGGAGALLVAAIVGGTLISSVLAAPSGTSTDTTALAHDGDGTRGAYCQAYVDALASELGITTDELATAARAAAAATIDAAVAAGDLTEERAAALKERLAEAEGNGCAMIGGRFGFGGHGGLRGHLPLGDLLGAAATSLGIEEADLAQRLRDGATLAEIAEAQGVDVATVTTAITDALGTALDEAVAAGDLTQERADEIAERVADALADGTWPERPGRGHHAPWGTEDAPAS
ncbi:MAG TPA: hypothetical protein VFM19_10240 [Candidatus Limnocylindria bacterium]|nr:hypothetical protein [Candidatus Limnocylindria bacterium]